jgi:hypothetical protein
VSLPAASIPPRPTTTDATALTGELPFASLPGNPYAKDWEAEPSRNDAWLLSGNALSCGPGHSILWYRRRTVEDVEVELEIRHIAPYYKTASVVIHARRELAIRDRSWPWDSGFWFQDTGLPEPGLKMGRLQGNWVDLRSRMGDPLAWHHLRCQVRGRTTTLWYDGKLIHSWAHSFPVAGPRFDRIGLVLDAVQIRNPAVKLASRRSQESSGSGRPLARTLSDPVVVDIDPLRFDAELSRFAQGGAAVELNPRIGELGAKRLHAYGAGTGRLCYRFDRPAVQVGRVEVTAWLSAEIPGYRGPVDRETDVTLVVNDRDVGTQTVIPDDGAGREYAWTCPAGTVRPGSNTLTFEVRPGSPRRNGICIYGTSVVPGHPDGTIRVKIGN